MSMLGEFIEQVDVRNSDGALGEDSVIGISTQKSFIFTKADLSGVSLTSYKKGQRIVLFMFLILHGVAIKWLWHIINLKKLTWYLLFIRFLE